MKKILTTLVVFALTLVSFYPQAVLAASDDELLFNIFIQTINEVENKKINLDMVESYFIEDDIATIIISNGNDGVIVYQTPINNENVIYEELKSLPAGITELNESSLESQNSIWPVIKAIWGIIKVVKAVVETTKMVCKMVEYGSGEDVCSTLSKEILNSLQPNVKYKAESFLHKNPNCLPAHSQQCNTYPNVYWKTVTTRV